MSNDLASYSPATDTQEIRSSLRGYALTDLPTVELHPVFDMPAPPQPATPRWSFLARALTALLLIDAAGLLYVGLQL